MAAAVPVGSDGGRRAGRGYCTKIASKLVRCSLYKSTCVSARAEVSMCCNPSLASKAICSAVEKRPRSPGGEAMAEENGKCLREQTGVLQAQIEAARRTVQAAEEEVDYWEASNLGPE